MKCLLAAALMFAASGAWAGTAVQDQDLPDNLTTTKAWTFTQTPVVPWGIVKWAVFVGTDTVTPTVLNQVAVASVTYINTGNYRVNFASPWTNADSYSCTCSATASGSSADTICTIGPPSTTPPMTFAMSMEVNTRSVSSGVENPYRIYVLCIGD